mgnify:CR=1 FL=1
MSKIPSKNASNIPDRFIINKKALIRSFSTEKSLEFTKPSYFRVATTF